MTIDEGTIAPHLSVPAATASNAAGNGHRAGLPAGVEAAGTTTSGQLIVDGVTVRYVYRAGTTPDAGVVFIHGWMDSMADSARNAEALAPHVPTLRLDLPGHGQSGHAERYSMEGYVAAVRAAIRHVGLDRPDVVGHSMGAAVATQLHRRDPSAVGRVVLLSPSLRPPPRGARLLAISLVAADRVGLLRPLLESLRRRSGFQACLADFWVGAESPVTHESRQILIDGLLATDHGAIVQGLRDTLAGTMTARPPARDGSFFLVYGAHDPVRDPDRAARLFRPGHVAVLPATRHTPNRTHVDTFHATLRAIRSVDPVADPPDGLGPASGDGTGLSERLGVVRQRLAGTPVSREPLRIPDGPGPDVAIVIPARNEASEITGALESVLAQRWPAERLEAIVVANACTDATADTARRFAAGHPELTVRVIETEQGGVSNARNLGAAAASAPRLIFLDADSRMTPYVAARAVQLDRDGVSVATYRFLTSSRDPLDAAFFWSIELMMLAGGFRSFNFYCRRDLFLEHGGFDPTLQVAEVADLFDRFRVAGVDVGHVPTVVRTSPRRIHRGRFRIGWLTTFGRWMLARRGIGRSWDY